MLNRVQAIRNWLSLSRSFGIGRKFHRSLIIYTSNKLSSEPTGQGGGFTSNVTEIIRGSLLEFYQQVAWQWFQAKLFGYIYSL